MVDQMIYLMKFVASFILPPGIFVIILFAIAAKVRKSSRLASRWLVGVTIVLYALTTNLVSDALLRTLEYRYTPPRSVSGDVIIMLGGGATSSAPDIGEAEGNLSGSASARLLTAARLQKMLRVPIILSGGQVYADTGREAIIAKRLLVGLGVEESQIMIEDQSLNTKQNARFVHKILEENHFSSPILVTSAFHMERALINFDKEHVPVFPFPTDYMTNREDHFYFNKIAPSASALQDSALFFREWLGIAAAKLVK